MAAPTLALPHAHVPLTGVAAASAVRPRTEMRYCCRAAGPPAVAASLPGCLVLRRGLKRTTRAFPAAGHVAPVAPVAEAEVSQAAFPVAGYNWEICTQQNYAQKDVEGGGRGQELGHLWKSGERFQDTLVRRLVELNGHGAPLREPRLVFTAGAMGVGKSHVIRWLAEKGILPMKDFVHINPDHLAAQRLRPTERGRRLMYALQQKRNILVDSSLRHGSWYSRVLQKIRQKLPEVRVVLMYVHAHEETIYETRRRVLSTALPARQVLEIFLSFQPNSSAMLRIEHIQTAELASRLSLAQHAESCRSQERANQRGLEGRMVSHVEVADSLEKIPLAIQKNPQRTPYINHPLAVARILAEVGIRDLKTLQAALLHDTLEDGRPCGRSCELKDTEATRAELEAAFGAEVANLVHALTDEEGLRPLHQKFRQLRRVKSLPLKAKLVRIADKLHNVWDIMHHGIPGWSKGKTERYVAWACEMVDALRLTLRGGYAHRIGAALSLGGVLAEGLPAGRLARVRCARDGLGTARGASGDLEHDGGSAAVPPPELAEHRAVLSLLRAAEVVAAKSDEELLESVKFALFLSGFGIKDPETLKAAVLLGSVDEHSITASQFGGELNAHWPRIVKNHKAKRIYLGKHLYELRKLQIGAGPS
eukprot:g24010.t1